MKINSGWFQFYVHFKTESINEEIHARLQSFSALFALRRLPALADLNY